MMSHDEYICDFCSAQPITTVYPARSFTVEDGFGLPLIRSLGGWAACAECASYIEQGDWKGLRERRHELELPSQPYLEDLWHRFAQARTGEVFPVGSPEADRVLAYSKGGRSGYAW